MIPGIKTIGIAVGIVVILLVLTGFNPLSVAQASTTTVGYLDHGVEGASPSASKDSTHPLPVRDGELLDSHAYVTSWDTLGLSEKIVATGNLRRDLNFHAIADCGFDEYFYRATFPASVQVALSDAKVNGTSVRSWDSPHIVRDGTNLINSNQWLALQNIVFYIQGPAVGVMHIELWVKNYIVDPYWPPNSYGPNWNKFQSDEANLLSGIGTVTVPQDVVEEGNAAHFSVRTGVSHSAVSTSTGGWLLQVFEPGTNPTISNSIWQQPVADNYNGVVNWIVPLGSYKNPTSATTPANWDNKYTVMLTNELFDQSHAWVFSIGKGMMPQIPNKPSLKVISGDMSNGGYTQGGLITVEISAIKNPLGYDVKDFIVSVQYIKAGGGDSTVVLSDTHYAAAKTNDTIFYARFSFVVPEAGTVTIWGDTFDINGLNSGVVKLNIGVTPYYPPGPGDGIDWLQIALIAGAILVLIGAIFLFVPGIPPVLKTLGWVLLIIGIALLICYAVVSFGLIKAAPVMIGGLLK